jgi:hypothetical protein
MSPSGFHLDGPISLASRTSKTLPGISQQPIGKPEMRWGGIRLDLSI